MVSNLTRIQIVSGFDFLNMRAGVGIPDTLIPYTEDSTYRRAILAGFVNTVFLSVVCIVTASLLRLLIAFGRLSRNRLLRKLCLVYVEVFRNLPLLLVILFCYFGFCNRYFPLYAGVLSFHFISISTSAVFIFLLFTGRKSLRLFITVILARIILVIVAVFLSIEKRVL